ncbi:hypothetical protein ACTA71_012440 [Dictyostelium dimigraforme]
MKSSISKGSQASILGNNSLFKYQQWGTPISINLTHFSESPTSFKMTTLFLNYTQRAWELLHKGSQLRFRKEIYQFKINFCRFFGPVDKLGDLVSIRLSQINWTTLEFAMVKLNYHWSGSNLSIDPDDILGTHQPVLVVCNDITQIYQRSHLCQYPSMSISKNNDNG